MTLLARALLLLAAVALLVACDSSTESEAEGGTPRTASVGDTVALTIYFRDGDSQEALLRPVAREVPIEGNLNKRAVELLLEGPTSDDEEGLESPWPRGTEVLDVEVDGGIAVVDLSSEALDEVDSGHSPHLEVLALGALANTLTEFPTIERVRLTIDGEPPEDSRPVAAFWGGWGLPRTLPRDETLIRADAGVVPELAEFRAERQSVGSEDAEPVRIRSVRVRDRITYVRVVIELANAADPDDSAPEIPRAYARTRPDGVVFEVTGIDSVDEDGLPMALDEGLRPYLSDLEVDEGQRPRSMRVTIDSDSAAERGIHLRTMDSPSRIVLDIRK